MEDLDLRRRIENMIRVLEGCSHAVCSMTDEIAESRAATILRQLICPHTEWKTFDGQKFGTLIVETAKVRPVNGYCAQCGIYSLEAVEQEKPRDPSIATTGADTDCRQ